MENTPQPGAVGQVTPPEGALYGRAAELEALRALLAQVIQEGRGHLLLLHGPEGIGKTRLVEHFHSQCDQLFGGVHLLTGLCDGDNDRMGGLGRLVRNRFYLPEHAQDEAARQQLLDGVRATLRNPVADDLAHLIGYLIGLPWPQSATYERYNNDPAQIQERARQALARLLERDAQQEPLILVLEDLHLIGPEPLALLQWMQEALRGAPVLWICLATEPCDLEERAPWLMDKGQAWLHHMELRSLSDRDTRQMIAATLRWPQEQIPRSLLSWLCHRAMGHPLRLLRALAVLTQQQVLSAQGGAWRLDAQALGRLELPDTTSGLARANLEGLDAQARRLLALAALIGEDFWLEAVQALDRSQAPFPEQSEAPWPGLERDQQIRDAFEALVERDIILPHRREHSALPQARALSFKHGLERTLALEHLPQEERPRLHNHLARWLLLAVGRQQPRPSLLKATAHHLHAAGHPHQASLALLEAAAQSAARHHYTSALRLLRQVHSWLPPQALETWLVFWEALGDAQAATSDAMAAQDSYRELMEAAWRMGAVDITARALNKQGRVHQRLGNYGLATKQLERALALYQEHPHLPGHPRCLLDLGQLYANQGHYPEAQARFEEALEHLQASGDARGQATALHHLGTARMGQGDLDAALEKLQQALALHQQHSDLPGQARTLNNLAAIHHQRGQLEQAQQHYQQAGELARKLEDRSLQGIVHNNQGEVALAQNQLERAHKELMEAHRLLASLGERPALFDTLRNLGQLALRRTERQEALDYGQRALEMARDLRSPERVALSLRALGEVHASTLFDTPERLQESHAQAESCFLESIELLQDLGNTAELGRTQSAYGHFLLGQGQLIQGRKRLEMARSIFERLQMGRLLQQTQRLMDEL